MAGRPRIYAHRGAKRAAPENTLPAFALALDMGVDGIELDVQATKDGRLAIVHDSELSHTTTGIGQVGDYTADELATFDAGLHCGDRWAGTPIPFLDQVVDLVGERAILNVEIKNTDRDGGAEVEFLVKLIQQRRLHERVLVSSFNPISLIKMRWHDPSIALGLLYHEAMPLFLRRAWLGPLIAPEALHPHASLVDANYVRWAHRQGHYVNTWTVNDVADARHLAALGVDVIMTDVPDQLLAALEPTP